MVTLLNLTGACASDSFNFKAKIIDQIGKNGRIDAVETMVPLKYSSNFWRTLEYEVWSNWNKTLCSSSYFINSRWCGIVATNNIRF